MATIRKACKGGIYPKSSSVSSRLGSPTKAKSGGSFPDLNKDGKVTRKDILIGRGVLPKTAQKGKKIKLKEDSRNYITKIKTDDKGNISSLKSRRTVKGLLTGAPRASRLKAGGKVRKAQAGDRLLKSVDTRLGGRKDVFISDDGKYRTKYKYKSADSTTPSRMYNRRTLKGFLTGAKRGIPSGGPTMRKGGSMKKCRYGCK